MLIPVQKACDVILLINDITELPSTKKYKHLKL